MTGLSPRPSDASRCLIVFAREPRLGKVKTRLAADLPAPEVLRLYESFVRNVLTMAARVRADERWVFYTGSRRPLHFLDPVAARHGFALRRQSGADLGERMLNAFRFAARRGAGKTVIIGTDCLTMAPEDIDTAYRKLDEADLVLGPATDGGYYLIGLHRPHPTLFRLMAWGGPQVLAATRRRARWLEWRTALLERKDDIDTIEDLRRFRSNGIKVVSAKWYGVGA